MKRMPQTPLNRRRFIGRAAASASLVALGGCDRLSQTPWFTNILDSAENLSRAVQRLITGRNALAREYSQADISKDFRANGTTEPDDDAYIALAQNGFADWRLEFGGLVERPASYSLSELRALPSRTQITRHDCVEGWSCIG